MYSLLYVSRLRVAEAGADEALAELVAAARQRNAERGLTGALLFTGQHFAQILEGERDAVDTLMRSIRRDPRHCDVQILDEQRLPARQFDGWALAYSGKAQYVHGHLERVADADAKRRQAAIAALRTLIRQFHSAGGAARRMPVAEIT